MKTVFPASYSTLCTNALARLINEKYGIEDIICQLLVRGVGDTYLVTTPARRLICRVYRGTHRNLSNIQAEVEMLNILKQEQIPVSYPIQDSSGEFIQCIQAIEGERYAVLFSYAEGQSIRAFNGNQLLNFGREMARFHNISSAVTLRGERWNLDTDSMFTDPLHKLADSFSGDPESYGWLKNAVNAAIEKLSQLPTAQFSSGYCHFDFLPKNVHFLGDAVTFFDFDFMGYGWLINDLMSFWQHFMLDVYLGRCTQEAANAAFDTFLEGYREYRDLSETELEAIPYLTLGFWLFYMGFHTTHDQFYAFIQPSHLKMLMGLFKNMAQKYWAVPVS